MLPFLAELCSSCALCLQPWDLGTENDFWVLWIYQVLVTITHTLICPGSLAIVMNCDCYTVQNSLQGYPERLNVQFTHNNFKMEKEISTRCSAESAKSLDSGGTAGLWMYYRQMPVFVAGWKRWDFPWQKEPHLATLETLKWGYRTPFDKINI